MYAATENHSILTISKWERRHARSFLTMPRTADQQHPEPGAVEPAIADVMLVTLPELFQGCISIYGTFSRKLAVNVKSRPCFSPTASGQAAKRRTAGLRAARERGALMAT